ncbi:MAG: EamA family transporter [Lachnospiraceae bacterium]|nr:EamA family transporter [Lachnospiraceae bacterium]
MENRKERIRLALICMAFGTIGAVAHFIALPSATIVFYRAFLGGAFLIVNLFLQGKKIDSISIKNNLILLTFLGLCLGFNWVFQFESFKASTVAIGTVCYNTMPIFLIIFSAIIFKEKIALKTIICIIVALIGVILVSNVVTTGIRSNQVVGCIYGIIGAIFYATAVTLNRKLKNVTAYDRLIYQFFISIIMMAFYIAFLQKGTFLFPSDISRKDLIIGIVALLLLGLFHTGFCYVHYFNAISVLPARDVAIFTFIDPVVALFLSYFALKEEMTALQFVGAMLIIISMFANEIVGKSEENT